MKAKRFFALLLLCSLALSLSVYADIAYRPSDDFYDAHMNECHYENRYYLVNSPEGSLVAYSSPTGSAKLSLPNGLEYYVSYTWKSGEATWGCIEYNPETLETAWWLDGESAWVDMALMTPRYDSTAFLREHESELINGAYSLFIEEGREVIAYRYPGSGIIVDRIPYSADWDNAIGFDTRYTDSEGREWGRVGYYYAIRDVWVCIDDPYTELPAGAEYREPEIYPAASAEAMDEALSEAQGTNTAVTILATGVIIIAAAIVAYIIIRKRKRA